MGQAKLRRTNAVPTVYHHTSTLRTNLIWMSGVIQLEGQSEGVFHPALGEVLTDVSYRRPCLDFPPLAWFTTRTEIPGCLVVSQIVTVDKDTGARNHIDLKPEESNAVSLDRVALGFPVSEIPIVPWSEHPGYLTAEGQHLNQTARESGDDPDDWWVSEQPIDVLKASEVWVSTSMKRLKLQRSIRYLEDVKRMVKICRDNPGAYIPPTWLSPEKAQELVRQLKLPVRPVR